MIKLNYYNKLKMREMIYNKLKLNSNKNYN